MNKTDTNSWTDHLVEWSDEITGSWYDWDDLQRQAYWYAKGRLHEILGKEMGTTHLAAVFMTMYYPVLKDWDEIHHEWMPWLKPSFDFFLETHRDKIINFNNERRPTND